MIRRSTSSRASSVPALSAAHVHRARLDRHWNRWQSMRLVLVQAGAGFGKTSFLADCVRRSNRPCCWVAVDPRCAGADGLKLALQRALAGPRRSARGAAFDLATELRHLPRGSILVLDDLQHLADSPDALQHVEDAIAFLPESSLLILSSREPMGVATTRLASQGKAARMRAADLRFTEEEVEALFAQRGGNRRLPPRAAHRVVTVTEGWAAGIQLLLRSLDGHSTEEIEAAAERFSRSGSDAFAYFAEEVMTRLDERTRDFLTRSAVLPVLAPDLCDRVLGIRTSAAILDRVRQDPFVLSTGDPPPRYRCHQLFRDFLLDRLARTSTPEERATLQRRSGDAFAEAGEWTEAAAAFVEAADFGRAVRVVEENAEALLAEGNARLLRRVLEGIPASELSRTPGALLLLARVLELQGEWERAEAVCARALEAGPGRPLRAEILALLGMLSLRRADFARSERYCRQAIEAASRQRSLRSGTLCVLGSLAAERGRLEEAEVAFQKANAGFRRSGNRSGEARVRYNMAASVHYFRGEFQSALDENRAALASFRALGDRRQTAHALGWLAFLHAAVARPDVARELAQQALRAAAEIRYRLIEGYALLVLGTCARMQEDPSEAEVRLEDARRIGDELQEPFLRIVSRIELAELRRIEGNRHAARRWVSQALELAQRCSDVFHEGVCRTLLGLLADGKASGARGREWKRSTEILRRMGAEYELHRLLLYRLSEESGAADERGPMLRSLLAGVARLDHSFLLLALEPGRAAAVLSQALRTGVEVPFALRLLEQLGPKAVAHLAPLLRVSETKVKRQAAALLSKIGGAEAIKLLDSWAASGGNLGREVLRAAPAWRPSSGTSLRLHALGSFRVSVGSCEIPETRWRGERAARLMALLLTHRFRWVHREAVQEALWPGAGADAAALNLRQSVLLLRRALEPELREPRRSRFVLFLQESYRLHPGDGYRYDVEEFEEAAREASILLAKGKRDGAESALRRALDLCRGEFLEAGPPDEFIISERERLRDRRIWALGRLVDLMEQSRRWEEVVPICRRGLADDPFAELFHTAIVRALLELSQRREALEAIRRYRQSVCRELRVAPSAAMRDLARQVAGAGG